MNSLWQSAALRFQWEAAAHSGRQFAEGQLLALWRKATDDLQAAHQALLLRIPPAQASSTQAIGGVSDANSSNFLLLKFILHLP